MGGPEDFGVRTRGLIRLLDLPSPRSRRLLGAVAAANLGQKTKLGEYVAFSPFHCIIRFYFVCFDLFRSFCPFFFVLLFCKNNKKISLFLFLSFKSLKKSKNIFFSLFSLLCRRVQLESVMAFALDYIFPMFNRGSDKAVMTKIDEG